MLVGLTTKEAASIIGVTTDQITKLCRQGVLLTGRHGRAWDIDENSVRAYAALERRPGPPKGSGGRPRKNP